MAVAPEELKPHPLANKDKLAKLNNEGRTPMVTLKDLRIRDNSAYSSTTEVQVLIPASTTDIEQRFTITIDEAKQIAQIQKELLLQ